MVRGGVEGADVGLSEWRRVVVVLGGGRSLGMQELEGAVLGRRTPQSATEQLRTRLRKKSRDFDTSDGW